MAIGNPISLTDNVASKSVTIVATAGQTSFSPSGGYRINELAVYRNGVRLVDGRDFTARDGATVSLASACVVDDVVEFQIFDDFRVADAINQNDSDQTIDGNLNIVGVLSATTLKGDGTNITGVGTQGLNVQAQSITVAGVSTFADDVRVLAGGLDVVGVVTSNNKVVATGLDIGTAGVDIDGQTDLDELQVAGVSTFSAKAVFNTAYPSIDADNELQVGTAIQLGKAGIVTALGLDISTGGVDIDGQTDLDELVVAGVATFSAALDIGTGGVDIDGQIDLDEVAVAGVATFGAALHSSDIRIKNIAEESSILAGNTVDLNWGTNGNVAICTTPSGDVTLRVNAIPTSGFDNQNITFTAIVASSGTARTCTAVKLNGVAKTILWAGGSLGNATDGLTTSMGYIVQSFTGINTIGSGSTAANYQVLGVINGPYEA